MSDLKEKLVKEAIKKAEEEALEKEKQEEKTDAAEEAGAMEAKAEEAEAKEADKETEAEPEADIAETAEEDTKAQSEKKKSIFSKKDKKDKKDEKIDELNDRLLRNLAEFDNYRKRTEKEKSQMFELGQKSLVEKILPTIDNFERGLAAIPETEKESPFAQGFEKIYKQMLSSLEEAGLKAIEAKGQTFDPNLHNAVMHEDNEELGENVVSEEFQKGYMFKDTVVRHSMVKVAN